MDGCPTCVRPFESFKDFPSILIQAVSLSTSEQVASMIIPGGFPVIVLTPEDVSRGIRCSSNAQVPPEAVEFFATHADQSRYAHADGWIYQRSEHHGKDIYLRIPNAGGSIQQLLSTNARLREYTADLATLVSQEVPPARLQPPWEPDGTFNFSFPIPDTQDFYLALHERKSGKDRDEPELPGNPLPPLNGHRCVTIDLLTDGPNLGSAGGPTLSTIFTIGHVLYDGRLPKTP